MTTRRQWHLYALSAVVSAALLAACGGGGSDQELSVGKVVSFGDSLSDLGTYSGTSSLAGTGAPPFFAGRFTTNTHTGYTPTSNTNTATMWVEWVASRVGVPITVAEVGFAGRSVKCPSAASPALADSCTGYGQGGSRVTDPIGNDHASGALTVPVVTQVANHLTKFGSFASNDLVFMFVGGNELLLNIQEVGTTLTPEAAVANMQTAGTELAAIVKDQIVAKGGRRVAVFTLPSIAELPRFNQLPPENKALLTQMAVTFNTALTTGLNGVNVRYVDLQALLDLIIANPAGYGFENVTTAACDPAKIAVITGGRITDGTSLYCNAAAGQPFNGMKAGASATKWLFADGVHLSTGGQKALGDYVITQIKNFGWIPPNL